MNIGKDSTVDVSKPSRMDAFVIFLNVICFLVLLADFDPMLHAALFAIVGVVGFAGFAKDLGKVITSRGIFTFFWMLSVALSCLRLHPIQQQWSMRTILSLGLVLPAFFAGYEICATRKDKFRKKRTYKTAEMERPIIVFGAVIVLGFIVDCIYSLDIPLINHTDMASYAEFGMPIVHYFTVASGLYPTLIYCYCKQNHKRILQSPVLLALTSASFLIPILIVSRQLMLLQFILLMFAFFLFDDTVQKIPIKRRVILVCCVIAVIVGLYLVLSLARNQDRYYLSKVFKLPYVPTKLGMAGWQMYLYVAFNFDNFNYLVNHLQSFSFGINSFAPVIAFLRMKSLVPSSAVSTEGLQQLPTYNTYPLLSPGYRDFGVVGVFVYLFVIGFVVAYVERSSIRNDNFIYSVIYYLVLYALVFCFFTSMFANTSFWADIFLLLVLANYQKISKLIYKRSG